MKRTYEELEERCQQLERHNRRLEKQNEELGKALQQALDRITALEEQLKLNSGNSSKPPSTDRKVNSKGQKKGKRKPRQGMARSLLPEEEIDHRQDCCLNKCPHCGSDKLQTQGAPLILQQVELPEQRGVVTQFDRHKYFCSSCHGKSIAPLPAGIPNSSFGPQLMSLLSSLTGVFHLSKDDANQLLRDLYGIEMSDGSIINIEERVACALRPVYDRIHEFVTESLFCKHFDETSWRDSGLTHYAWVATTKQAVCYRIDRYRNKPAFQAVAGRLNRQAPVVTDRYNVYKDLDNPHQHCIPHLIRNFRRFSQRDGPDGILGSKIEKELQHLCFTHAQHRKGELSKSKMSQRVRRCRERVDGLFMDAMVEGSKQLGDLSQRLLLDDFDKLWTFQKHWDAEPSNNLAERALRRLVLWRKKSYGTRSDRGKRFVETISTVSETLRRSGLGILKYIKETVTRFYEGKQAPEIQPNYGF